MANQVVFLFGAGASNGVGHILPCAPPLGRYIYDKLAECFPEEWGPGSQLACYSAGLRQDFEKTMFNQVCFWNSSLAILEWQQQMAVYFSRFTPDSTGEDLYSRLLSFLRDTGKIRNTIFASLNYDCIFEQAAYKLGFQVDYSCGETEDNAIRVFKVHGSCNFITGDIGQWKQHLTNPNSHLNCRMNCLRPVDVEKTLESNFSDVNAFYYPVMSLYSFGKDSLVSGTRIQEIRNAWRRCVSNASVVVIIGVRPNSEDTHVWIPIMETPAKPFYIGFDSWAPANSRFKFLGKTFEKGFDNLRDQLQ